MKKKYCKPKVETHILRDAILIETSGVGIGGSGSFDAKNSYLDFYNDEDEY